MKAIFLFQRDMLVPPDEHSMLFHETGHALDWVMGKGEYLSESLDCGEPLDSHASKNPREQFAQAFEGWMRGSHITPKGDLPTVPRM